MIKNISKAEQLKEMLLGDIRTGIYRPGDALPSIRDLATRYEVSKQTVTQALSNLGELKVIEIAHGKATRLRENPFRSNIEIIYFGQEPVGTQSFWSEFYQGIVAEAGEHPGYMLNLTTLYSSSISSFLEHFDPTRTCGILAIGNSEKENFRDLQKFGIPVISLYSFSLDSGVPFVTSSLDPVIDRIARQFHLAGRNKVAICSFHERLENDGVPMCGPERHRHEYAIRQFRSENIMPDDSYARIMNSKHDGAYQFLHQMAKEGKTPDGLFLASDAMALGAYRAAYELGLKIPDDLAIVGCDNLQGDDYMVPSLASIELDRREQGRCALRQLVEWVEKQTPLQSREIPAKLVQRESFP